MKMISVRLFLLLVFATDIVNAQQKVIHLYNGAAPGSENWKYNEQEYKAGTKDALIYNVSHPTLTVYPANPFKSTGTAVIVWPGGNAVAAGFLAGSSGKLAFEHSAVS